MSSQEPYEEDSDEGDNGYALFVKNGTPVRFYIHRSIKKGGQRAVLKSKIQRYGGIVVDETRGVDTMLVKMDPQARYNLQLSYDVDEDPILRQIFVEDITFVQFCIQNSEFAHKRPRRKPMGGRRGGANRSRVEFTEEDQRHMAHFIAMRVPDPEAGGRTGNRLYQDLCGLGDTDRPEAAWASRHHWESWRGHYKRHQAKFDKWIAEIVATERPGPKQWHSFDKRLCKKQYHHLRQESEESEDDIEDGNSGDERIRQKRLRGSEDDEASPAKKRHVKQGPSNQHGRSVDSSSPPFENRRTQRNIPGPSGTQSSPTRSRNIPPPSQGFPSSQMTLVEGQNNLRPVRATPRMAARRPRPAPILDDEPEIIAHTRVNQSRPEQLPALHESRRSPWIDVSGDVDLPESSTPRTMATNMVAAIQKLPLGKRPVGEAAPPGDTSVGAQNPPQQLNTQTSDQMLSRPTRPREVSLSTQQQAPVARRGRKAKTSQPPPNVPEEAPFRNTRSRSRSVEPTMMPPPTRRLNKSRGAQARPLQPLVEADVEDRPIENNTSPGPRSASLPTIAFLNQEEDDKDDIIEISNPGPSAPPGETLAEEQDVEKYLVVDDYSGLSHRDVEEPPDPPVRSARRPSRDSLDTDDGQTIDVFRRAGRSELLAPRASSYIFDANATPGEVLESFDSSLLSNRNAARFKSDSLGASLQQPPPFSRTPSTRPTASTSQNNQPHRGSTSSSETFPLVGTQASSVRKRIEQEEKYTPYRPPPGTRAAEHLRSRG
ncbi:hypothetical protein BD779DRAFT_187604 [Infundibulicybe gibba]|nr:hypothetical protein BD779DRAFT_187604 [Infundibulicybe gibba]